MGKHTNQLSSASNFLFALEWNPQTRDKTIGEALEHGERAITLLSSVGESGELSKAYVKTALCLGVCERYFIPDMGEKERCNQKAMDYWRKASELSEDAALLELLTAIVVPLNLTCDEMLTHFKNALDLPGHLG